VPGREGIDGPTATPRVVALHGVGGGGYFFRDLAAALEGRYRVRAPDLVGRGGSFSFDDWLNGLRLVLDDPGGPAFVIGHSLGTIIALELWRRWPDSIRGIVFVGGLPRPREVIRERLAARIAAIRADGTLAGWGPKISPAVFSARSRSEHPDVVSMFERRFEAQDPGRYLRSLELLIAADARDVVPTVTVPCASISGAEDFYAPPEDVTAFLAHLPAPAESIVLPEVGHVPFFEAPDAFAAAVGRVLDGWTPGRG